MNRGSGRTRSRRLAPEVVQTSAMDCGPAALKCLLEGFGIRASYGRLREACQTDVDGTSIDTLEEIACRLGLDAEQIMLPLDHLLLSNARTLPALVVTRLPGGVTHFIVVWRRHGAWVQLMDPATGRQWVSGRELLSRLYVHQATVSADYWRSWAGGNEFLGALRQRLAGLGIDEGQGESLIRTACDDPGWRGLATLDAVVRAATAIVRSRGLKRGREVFAVVERLFARERERRSEAERVVPPDCWSVAAAPPSAEGESRLFVRGAVLVRVNGVVPPATDGADTAPRDASERLSPELAAALAEPPTRPGRELLRLLGADGLFVPGVLLAALLLAAGGVIVEAVLIRGLLELSRDLGLAGQRVGALAAVLIFLGSLFLIELPLIGGVLRYGRKLELRLRVAFLRKIPRLRDRYFQSRLASDMAERGHSMHQVRDLPEIGRQLLRAAFALLLTTAGIAWLDPRSAPIAALAAACSIALPLLAQPILAERDLRVRTHGGALSRFYLDALLGLIPIRLHGAERSVRREHERLLGEWARAGLRLQQAAVALDGLQIAVGFGLAAWLLFAYLGRGGELGVVLLLVYWALNLPVLGQELGLMARQYPEVRSLTLRLLEPLGALEQAASQPESEAREAAPDSPRGVGIALDSLGVRVAGHPILSSIDLTIKPGEHVAIVGPSGAGKSTLAGTLLGWHRASAGRVVVDGETLDDRGIAELRRKTAWVDPAVRLWNRTLLDNLCYGNESAAVAMGQVVETADLQKVIEHLPDGLQTRLGEAGALVSGGEGQRVRLGRALLRRNARLVILDEPFRGLDREQRRRLLAGARRWWAEATLLCITHDVGDTRSFDRVVVVEHGRIVEDGAPSRLVERAGSRFAELLDSEQAIRETLWSSERWRHVRLAAGRLSEGDG